MESRRRIIVKEPEPVVPVRAPKRAPPAPQRKVAPKPTPKPRKPRAKKPLVITITVLHEVDEAGNDVLFNHEGQCPADIDLEAFEQYIADFFGEEDECDEDEDEFYEDDEE